MVTGFLSLQGEEKVVQAVIQDWKSEKPYLKNRTGQVCPTPTPLTISISSLGPLPTGLPPFSPSPSSPFSLPSATHVFTQLIFITCQPCAWHGIRY